MNPIPMPMDDCDSLLTCPYFKSHQVTASRMSFHLTKCEHVHKVNGKSAMARCKYNSVHHVEISKLFHHLETCPDRRLVEKTLTRTAGQDKAVIQEYEPPTLPHAGESWDDLDAPTYDPQVKAIHAPVLRTLQGATKSQRKKHKMIERKRLMAIRDGESVLPYTRDGNTLEHVEAVERSEQLPEPLTGPKHAYDITKPLRMPRTRSETFCLPLPLKGGARVAVAKRRPAPGKEPRADEIDDPWCAYLLHSALAFYYNPDDWIFEDELSAKALGKPGASRSVTSCVKSAFAAVRARPRTRSVFGGDY